MRLERIDIFLFFDMSWGDGGRDFLGKSHGLGRFGGNMGGIEKGWAGVEKSWKIEMKRKRASSIGVGGVLLYILFPSLLGGFHLWRSLVCAVLVRQGGLDWWKWDCILYEVYFGFDIEYPDYRLRKKSRTSRLLWWRMLGWQAVLRVPVGENGWWIRVVSRFAI